MNTLDFTGLGKARTKLEQNPLSMPTAFQFLHILIHPSHFLHPSLLQTYLPL